MKRNEKVMFMGKVTDFTTANRKKHSSFACKGHNIYPFGRLLMAAKSARVQLDTLGYVMVSPVQFQSPEEYRTAHMQTIHVRITECLDRPFNRSAGAKQRGKDQARERVWQHWQGKGWTTLANKYDQAVAKLEGTDLVSSDEYINEFMRLINKLGKK